MAFAKALLAVVAIDSDRVVMGELWRRARSQGLNILPLVVNLVRLSPARAVLRLNLRQLDSLFRWHPIAESR
jgi:hypothetical protein